ARVHRAGEDADHNVERLLVGDPQPVDLPLLDPRRAQGRVDFLPAAVNDDERRGRRDRPDRFDDAGEMLAILEKFTPELEDGRLHSSPVRSSSPSITFMFCTAWPAAPLS